MDRFIGKEKCDEWLYQNNLKSNMDRFIDLQQQDQAKNLKHLKSNMDRFIAKKMISCLHSKTKFKIQYG